MKLTAVAFPIAAILAGCAVGADPQPTPTPAEPTTAAATSAVSVDDDSLVTRTIVVVHADGTKTVTESQVTRAAQQIEVSARLEAHANPSAKAPRPETITTDCSTADVMLFSETSYAGDYLCLESDSTTAVAVDLSYYTMGLAILGRNNPTWYTCDPGYIRRLGGPCGGPGVNHVQSYVTLVNACFSQNEGSTIYAPYTNISAESASVNTGNSIVGDEFLWLSSTGVKCGPVIISF